MTSIFSKIINKELPGHFVYDDEHCVVIMTIQPRNPGHILVIPREEVDHWDDLKPELMAHLTAVSQKMAKAIKRAFPAKRVGVLIAGLAVPHVHIHVFPANEITDFDLALSKMATPEALATACAAIQAQL